MTCDILAYSDIEPFHGRYFAKNKPVIIRGARDADSLNIFRWSGQHLREQMASTKVPVLTTTTGFLSYERDVVEIPFEEFVERSFGSRVDAGLHYYFKNPTTLLPPGQDDSDRLIRLQRYIRKAVFRNLWISSGGLTVGLHFDAAENLNIQIRGSKCFTLYPPGIRGFYPLPMFSQTAHISAVFRSGPTPDLQRFPHFDPSKAIQIHVQEGDILYVPAYWWHQVESLGQENVNLNFWWVPPLYKQVRYWNQALRGYIQILMRYAKFRSVQKAPPSTQPADESSSLGH